MVSLTEITKAFQELSRDVTKRLRKKGFRVKRGLLFLRPWPKDNRVRYVRSDYEIDLDLDRVATWYRLGRAGCSFVGFHGGDSDWTDLSAMADYFGIEISYTTGERSVEEFRQVNYAKLDVLEKCLDLLDANPEVFDDLVNSRQSRDAKEWAESKEYPKQVKNAEIRNAANTAFREKRFGDAITEFEKLEDSLTDVDKKKMEIAIRKAFESP